MATVIMQLDPNNAFRDISPSQLYAMTGYLSGWAQEYLQGGSDSGSLHAHLKLRYGLNLHPFKVKFDSKHRMLYPGDPPQNPIAIINVADKDEYLIIYQYGFVAIVKDDEPIFCRMD